MAVRSVMERAEALHLRHRLSRTQFFSTGSNETRDSLLIRVEDHDGLIGWGETYLVPGAREAADGVCRWLVRQDAETAAVTLAGLTGAHRWVLSAATMAMDDLRARQRGIPLARLYGEPVRTRVRPYASSAGYVAGRSLRDTWAEEAAAARTAGFGAFKLRIGREDPAAEVAAIREAHQAVPGLDWMADVNAAWSAETTRRQGPELAELGLRWLEEPMSTADYPAYAPLRRELAIPIAGGESVESPGEAAEALTAGAFDIIQPDASICGGVAPLLRIAAAASAQGIGCIPHACNGAVSLAATLQVLAVLGRQSPELEAGPLLEHDFGENPLRTDLLSTPLTVRDGWMEIPDGPGLGVDVDESVVAALRVSMLTAGSGDAAVAAAVDLNFADLLAWYASFPGGRLDQAPDRWMCITGVPFRAVNAVVRADLDRTEAAARINATVDMMRATGHPWRWLVGPTARPIDLPDRLQAAGLSLVSDSPGMALDIAQPLVSPPVRIPGVVIRRVASNADLDAWAELQRHALGLDATATAAWRTVHARPGFGEDVTLRTSIAMLDGRAVASAALFVAAGVAGVYNVCTLPEFRGRGIGRAITATVIEDGQRHGLRVAVLGASPMGEPVYRGVGFREVCRLRNYTVLGASSASQSGYRVSSSVRQAR